MYSPYRAPISFQLTPWVKRLLILNGAMFLLTFAVGPALADWLAFSPSRLLTRPWGLVTYMFVHGDFWHLFWNMVGLFFFGPPLESRWGSREFLRYYFVCGIGGVVLSFLFVSSSIIGASAAVYGIMLAFAMAWPEAPIYLWGILPVKAKWLVGFLATAAFISAVGGGGGNIAHFAHLGGFLAGFLYLKSDWRPSAAVAGYRRRRERKRLAIVPREESAGARRSREGPSDERSPVEEALLDEVDRVLDKISSDGMDSLTDEERRLLDQVSRMHRSN